jgi:hypothetical protein
MPLANTLFWAFFASYVVHIIDETLLNGGFVQWIKDNFWPTYHVRMFFWFNAAFLAAISNFGLTCSCSSVCEELSMLHSQDTCLLSAACGQRHAITGAGVSSK